MYAAQRGELTGEGASLATIDSVIRELERRHVDASDPSSQDDSAMMGGGRGAEEEHGRDAAAAATSDAGGSNKDPTHEL